MEILEINNDLLYCLHRNAIQIEKLRINYDLRTTPNDYSQRMLNILEIGTHVPIHRHLETSESTFCLQGNMDIIFYDLQPNNESDSNMCSMITIDGKKVNFYEVCRVRLCPSEGKYGVQIPVGTWHSVEVYEPSTIFEAKDGAYKA